MPETPSTWRDGDARFRVLLWFNDRGPTLRPIQVACAVYRDDEKLTELTFTPGPFDDLEDVVAYALETVMPEQLRLY